MNQYTMCIDVGGKGKENKKDGGLLNGLGWRDIGIGLCIQL